MLTYEQSTGNIRHENGDIIGVGYSGLGEGKNNPADQWKADVGPIPQGIWIMTDVINAPDTGPFSILLAPDTGTDTHGRSGFRIHGDSVSHPGEASHGCIILPPIVRHLIWAGKDHKVKVVE